MKNILWKCSNKKLKDSNLFKFENFLKTKYEINYNNNYEQLWKWSIENLGEFWQSIWEFSNIKGQLGNNLIDYSRIFFKNKLFGLKVNKILSGSEKEF